ncbi:MULTISPECIES: glycosyltransferase family 4 protein [Rhizobium/Agrobacterium group]|uniref:glycosyltransferase family 4 protein n=2 Tax=Rhizobium/Agrobacterium group TaxID=227290 RepID=UPI0003F20F1A|nr:MULTISPECIES: glycosyltransferase [Rhizobium/Agrobacterium group]AHK04334.1 hypothetical protein X971_4490 [Agrobacterium tumefaciens LBA4213 (Ach5)]AKC10073.1 hypothetical protein Ach5_43000 [Agrobacterium tumefaciens]AYM19217.1 hypothetical protein At15955_42320 [Agrobacterium tumefaciens]AYM70518.1 hypothetical protein AtA6_43020 [Agrobacterium tumefaciens]MDH7808127.1 glycosyltransferase involved in cell wall biosynthesis [Rhizobium sp. AN67]
MKRVLKPVTSCSRGFAARVRGTIPRDFSSKYYLKANPDVAAAGYSAVEHYLEYGKAEGRTYKLAKPKMTMALNSLVGYIRESIERSLGNIPRDFKSQDYLEANPDVAAAGHSAVSHFLEHGKSEGRTYKLESPVEKTVKAPDSSKKNILFVSHEASRTGAPIVCLKLIEALNEKYNIICLLLGPGALEDNFERSVNKIYKITKNHPILCLRAVNEILKADNIHCAIVNSVVSIYALEALSNNQIPTISLIHEFTTYINPHHFMEAIIRSSSVTVYSAEIIKADAVNHVPEWQPNHRSYVVPQGRCVLEGNPEKDKVDAAFQPAGLNAAAKVIMGAGSFSFRKGVEFFLQTCSYILKNSTDKNLRFVWFGGGYDPEKDFEFSLYFKEQIIRSGLENHIEIVGNIGSLEYAYSRATAFLLTSRLDPLPNVGLDSICHGLPIFCFAGASGVADVLQEEGLGDLLISPHLDSYDMAKKVVDALEKSDELRRISEQLSEIGRRRFSMERYVNDIDALIDIAVQTNHEGKKLAARIADNDLIDVDFWGQQKEIRGFPKPETREAAAWQYVRETQSGIKRRRPRANFEIFDIVERETISIDVALRKFSQGDFG